MACAAVIIASELWEDAHLRASACLDGLRLRGVPCIETSFGEKDLKETLVTFEGTPSDIWALVANPSQLERARELGLSCCAILPEGVAVAEDGLASAELIIHGFGELSFGLLDDFAKNAGEEPLSDVLRALIVCGSPEPSSNSLVGCLADAADYVIACDRGAKVCRAAHVRPDAFVGDGDSADSDTLAWVYAKAPRIIGFPSEKYATDLSLAIDAARHEAARRHARLELVLTCASGGRPDHGLAVLGQALAAADAAPRIVEDSFELRILSPKGRALWHLGEDAKGHTVSLIALVGNTVVSERRMRWELDGRELAPLGDEGISNVVMAADAEIECMSGACAVYLLRL